jgi:hypothetical protein
MSGAAHSYRLGLERLLRPETTEEAKYRIARPDAATAGVGHEATTGVA